MLRIGPARGRGTGDGIRLIADLRRGNTDVLQALFPDVVAALKSSSGSTPPSDDLSGLKSEVVKRTSPMPNGFTKSIFIPSPISECSQ